MKGNKKYPLIIIEWNDVSTYDGWKDIEDTKKDKPFQAKMVGWEISRDKENIIVVTAFSETECNGRRVIPMGCIRQIKELKENGVVRQSQV